MYYSDKILELVLLVIIASFGASRGAKRATIIHLLFNTIGTVVFVTICMLFPFTDFIVALSPNSVQSQIANVHTVFNISTTLLLLPFGNQLCKIVEHILPVQDDETDEMQTVYITEQDSPNFVAINTND